LLVVTVGQMAEARVAVFENLLNLGLTELSVFGRIFL
jgi:hypothetical protein